MGSDSIFHYDFTDGEEDEVNEQEEVNIQEEEEEEEEEEERGEVVSSMHHLESMREISIKQCHHNINLEEEIEGMKYQLAAFEERKTELETHFYDYCNMKEQESAFQKLQIMCLGFKLESLESEKDKLEGTIAECKEAMEQFETMRGEIRSLQKKMKKLTRANKVSSHLTQQQVLKLQLKEEEILMRNDELKHANEEIKELAEKLSVERKAMEETSELRASIIPLTSKSEDTIMVEYGDMLNLNNKYLLGQLQQVQGQWFADVEELIYLGWVNAYLRREVFINQEEEEESMHKVKDEVVLMELPVSEHVGSCNIELYDSDSPSIATGDHGEAFKDVAYKKHTLGSRKPKLLHKLKGWAKGKEMCQKACGEGKIPTK